MRKEEHTTYAPLFCGLYKKEISCQMARDSFYCICLITILDQQLRELYQLRCQ